MKTYEDGYNDGWLQATLRAEGRQELGLPLVLTAEDDDDEYAQRFEREWGPSPDA